VFGFLGERGSVKEKERKRGVDLKDGGQSGGEDIWSTPVGVSFGGRCGLPMASSNVAQIPQVLGIDEGNRQYHQVHT
jgi:hypothetical protein